VRIIDRASTLAVQNDVERPARLPSIRADLGVVHQLQHALDLGASRSIWLTVPEGTRGEREWLAPVGADDDRGDPYPSLVYALTGFSTAPSGMIPCVAYRHNAMTSFRATATMPTRRLRPPAASKRRRNHWVKALSG
jgi:hypothetical protein